MKMTKKKWLLYCFYLPVVTIILLEVILRLYNPYRVKIRGQQFELLTNTEYRLVNPPCTNLDKTVIYKINSLGFRGDEPPKDVVDKLSILTIGGSTTASSVITEGKTWTDLLGKKLAEDFRDTWINNAGLNGYSTYGTINFMEYYLRDLYFKPKVAIFLVGANDVDRDDLDNRDTAEFNRIPRSFKNWLKQHSETVNLVINLKSRLFPQKHFTLRDCWDFSQFTPLTLESRYIDSALRAQTVLTGAFRKRVEKIIDVCSQYNILPVLMTQPIVSPDSSTTAAGKKIGLHPFRKNENLALFARKVQLYNEAIKQIALERSIACIDLAARLSGPDYFYDFCHFNNPGSAEVADAVHAELKELLGKKFPEYKNNLLTK